MLRAGFLGPANGAPPRDPEAMAMLFDAVARAVDHRTAPAGPFAVQWEFADAEPWHLRVDNGSTAAAPGRAPQVDLEVRVPLRGLGRHRGRQAGPEARDSPPAGCARTGSPRALWAARSLF